MRLGKKPRGIFASAWARSEPFEDDHWSNDDAGKLAFLK